MARMMNGALVQAISMSTRPNVWGGSPRPLRWRYRGRVMASVPTSPSKLAPAAIRRKTNSLEMANAWGDIGLSTEWLNMLHLVSRCSIDAGQQDARQPTSQPGQLETGAPIHRVAICTGGIGMPYHDMSMEHRYVQL